jgi:hypothetical protein
MGLLDQQKNAGGAEPPPSAPKTPEQPPAANHDVSDLTGLEAMLKAAASNPGNMANARKGKTEGDDTSDVTDKSDEELGLVKYTEADYKIAEDVVFQGFASRQYVFGRDNKFRAVVTTTTANEELIIDELLSEFAGTTQSNQSFNHYTAIVMMALSLQSLNDKAFPDNPRLSLDLLKNALKKLIEFERDGLVDKYKLQHDQILKLVKARISYIKMLPTPVLDVLAKKRSELETLVIKLLEGGILKNS